MPSASVTSLSEQLFLYVPYLSKKAKEGEDDVSDLVACCPLELMIVC